MPSSGPDSEPSLCVEGGGGHQRGAPACASVRLRERVIYNGPTSLADAYWLPIPGLVFYFFPDFLPFLLLFLFNLKKSASEPPRPVGLQLNLWLIDCYWDIVCLVY